VTPSGFVDGRHPFGEAYRHRRDIRGDKRWRWMFLPQRWRHLPDYKAMITKNTTVSSSSLIASLSLIRWRILPRRPAS